MPDENQNYIMCERYAPKNMCCCYFENMYLLGQIDATLRHCIHCNNMVTTQECLQ